MIVYSIQSKGLLQTIKDTLLPGLQRMNKREYIRFVEEVKQIYAPDEYITFKNVVPFAGQLPVHYKISCIDELHFTVKYNELYKEPACLVCKKLTGDFIHLCPKEIRKLTTEELNLVNILNQKQAGNTVLH